MFFQPYAFTTALDLDAAAFLSAAGITNNLIVAATNQLVIDMKATGLWTKMLAIYPIVGGTADTHKYNLKNPANTDAAFRLTYSGGITHSSTGMLPNGTNGYANTYFAPSTHLNVNSTHLSIYIGTNNVQTTADPVIMGAFVLVEQSIVIVSAANYATRNLFNTISASQATRAGYIITTKTSSTVTDLYKNGTLGATGNSGGTLPTSRVYIGNISIDALNTPYNNGWDNNEVRFATIGNSLNSTDATNLNNIVQTFQTTLGRQV
jgi:hypothetical protein